MTEGTLYRQALQVFGRRNQIIVAIEELSELQKELTKMLRSKGNQNHLAEEIADARIMIDQMEALFCLHDDVEYWKAKKLERLERRLSHSDGILEMESDRSAEGLSCPKGSAAEYPGRNQGS